MKDSKAKAKYREGHGDKLCQNCTMFVPPEACTSVEGYIDSLGLCDYFKMKKGD